MTDPVFSHDPEARACYLALPGHHDRVARTREVQEAEGVIILVDYDCDGRTIGIEVLY